MSADTLPPLREVIAAHGLGADKRFGQHFLLDLNLTAKIARLCGDMSAATFVEIGPGPGGLTRALLSEGARRVIAIEKDARFLPALEEVSAAFGSRLKVIEADALTITATALGLEDGERAIIAANLPYNVGTALYTGWLEAEPVWWSRAVLMFQKEVAQRIVAPVGDDAYGRLAILTAARAQAKYAFTLPARAFTPPPKVDSAVVVVDPLPDGERFDDTQALSAVTASAFGQRRKTLRKSLAQAASQTRASAEELLAACDIDPGARAETIPPEGFMALARAWRAARS
ncbi:MAG: 16S rRNA (adenine(1518)-N(6)/adenine(1519)-N(6))-dimethyltransferase RsmA [Oceanicaulis sp.]|uniref:16S rRNA (adenine(1518)-N(6)/adenine(1519)-N(6))- dimethyltransferase RsmA n=1 Tax=Glycocaulis sp. TaxID=1969725 RepID=UPI0025BF2E78|nr:16S rRNA (adenine(1518)-N(6)/adenine(1519)-N(6))-dimethyltransferase RsmA [Glycocaulis sp.]MCC5981973.1 16S rRNA (adenine(1518)-N(6)/adenine(1519)-N(6))-dimethyltransferase RsmA [Oceanicaulis sp.]MCH8521857.1 16S rRNA (adenine(1518)-N(6)/adenine(1519)-N(6))-dimethyltransferase RsmA [Glycocaulis sp.]